MPKSPSQEHLPPAKPAGHDARASSFLERRLLLCLLAISALALYWPAWTGWMQSQLGIPIDRWGDPFVQSKGGITALIAITMFFVGWMLPTEQVDQVLRGGRAVILGVAIQYVSMPLLAWAIAQACGMTGPHWIGFMVVGAVPGAMASNVLTLNARGNTSYSVSLTTAATLLSPLIVPLVLRMTLGAGVDYDAWAALRLLTLRVVVPVLAGHVLRRATPQWTPWAERLAPTVANVAILWIIAIVVALNRERLVDPSGLRTLTPLLALNVCGYLTGYWGGRAIGLDEPMRRALTLEVGMQNAGVGTMLALKMFPDNPAVALAPAAYTFGCMLTGAGLARWWMGRRPAAD